MNYPSLLPDTPLVNFSRFMLRVVLWFTLVCAVGFVLGIPLHAEDAKPATNTVSTPVADMSDFQKAVIIWMDARARAAEMTNQAAQFRTDAETAFATMQSLCKDGSIQQDQKTKIVSCVPNPKPNAPKDPTK